MFGARGATAEPTLEAELVDEQAHSKEAAAVVQVHVAGIELVDPGSAGETPKAGQGHLHYRVDGGPVVATPASKLAFHELAPGPHRIEVELAGNDHKPLGPSETLTLTVPASTAESM
jgi:hypothetical protein